MYTPKKKEHNAANIAIALAWEIGPSLSQPAPHTVPLFSQPAARSGPSSSQPKMRSNVARAGRASTATVARSIAESTEPKVAPKGKSRANMKAKSSSEYGWREISGSVCDGCKTEGTPCLWYCSPGGEITASCQACIERSGPTCRRKGVVYRFHGWPEWTETLEDEFFRGQAHAAHAATRTRKAVDHVAHNIMALSQVLEMLQLSRPPPPSSPPPVKAETAADMKEALADLEENKNDGKENEDDDSPSMDVDGENDANRSSHTLSEGQKRNLTEDDNSSDVGIRPPKKVKVRSV